MRCSEAGLEERTSLPALYRDAPGKRPHVQTAGSQWTSAQFPSDEIQLQCGIVVSFPILFVTPYYSRKK